MVSVVFERFLSLVGNFEIAVIELSVQLGSVVNDFTEFVTKIITKIDSSISSALSNVWFFGYLKESLIYYTNKTENDLSSLFNNVTSLTSKSQQNLNNSSKLLLTDLVSTIAEVSETLKTSNAPQRLMCHYTYSGILQRTSVLNLQNFSSNCLEVYHESIKSGVQHVRNVVQEMWNASKELESQVVNFDFEDIEQTVRCG